MPATFLTVGVGDIHGRFHRVEEWLAALEGALFQPVDVALAVGDVEAFRTGEEHKRKAAKRQMPAEFADYASGARTFRRPLAFIGGNNEDFEALQALPEGGDLVPNVRYLGRVGVRRLGEVNVGFLSGIFAPRHIDTPLRAPTTLALAKRAGYFRRPEVEQARALRDVDLLLLHEWPKGLVPRSGPRVRAQRFPWIGNPLARRLVEELRPAWVLCGHSHVPLAAEVVHPGGEVTRVACLDQAARPEGAVFWLRWDGRRALEGGWGVTGEVSWRVGDRWDSSRTPPEQEPATESP